MTSGDAAYWDDLFSKQLLPAVFALVLDAWERIDKPAADEHEDRTSVRLYSAMMRGKDRQRHAFLIRYQDVEVDTDLAKVTGRKDIVFFPTLADEDIYFCLEAKRLNALVGGVWRSLASEYVTEGMCRFVNGKYASRVRQGGMLGYVLDGDADRAIANVDNAIRVHHDALGMEPPGEMRASDVRPDDLYAKETDHNRRGEAASFRIHHLFVVNAIR